MLIADGNWPEKRQIFALDETGTPSLYLYILLNERLKERHTLDFDTIRYSSDVLR